MDNETFNNDIDWEDITDRIRSKKFMPIISDQVLVTGPNDVVAEFSKKIKYPYPFQPDLSIAQLTQYDAAVRGDVYAAKARFLRFFKKYLLNAARRQASQEDSENTYLESLAAELPDLTVSEVASRIGYPWFDDHRDNPFQVLAAQRLPIYITTSYYQFLEHALEKAGKKPRTEICYWHPELSRNLKKKISVYENEPDYLPTPEEPLVYHLHGLDAHPESMVITEDDYVDFLIGISRDVDAVHVKIREAFVDYSLLLLGYQLEDWGLKVLLRGLILQKRDSRRYFSISIQLTPEQIKERGLFSNSQVQIFLKKYFEKVNFGIYWGTPREFARQLFSQINDVTSVK